MKTRNRLCLSVAAIAVAAFLNAPYAQLHAQQADPAIHVGANDLGGVVTGPNGPEAGVWVIAETTDLGTKMSKMVVTDDQGRYVLPDLPKANYSVWVRGYGLVDSAKVQTAPGKMLNLTAVKAPKVLVTPSMTICGLASGSSHGRSGLLLSAVVITVRAPVRSPRAVSLAAWAVRRTAAPRPVPEPCVAPR